MPGPATPLAPLWGIAALLIAGCGAAAPEARDATTPSPPADDQPPVPIDAVPPVEYPPALYEQRVSGTVLLRLFVDTGGTVVSDSSRIQESSGVAALDSAALAAAPKLRYAPALRNGRPVAAPFVQPIHFRHPSGELPAP
jgi:protein TonB